MRKLLLTIIPAIAIAALPAFAQSNVSTSESTTTTTGVVQAPVVTGETVTKKVYKSESNTPGSAESVEHRSERKVTTDGLGETSTVAKSEHHAVVEGVDGSRSERNSTTTTETGPN